MSKLQYDPKDEIDRLTKALRLELANAREARAQVAELRLKSRRQRHAYRELQDAYMSQIGVKKGRLERLRRDVRSQFWEELDEDLADRLVSDARRIGSQMIELRQVRKLLKASRCPDEDCVDGSVPHGPDPDGNWTAQQCQWCEERRRALER